MAWLICLLHSLSILSFLWLVIKFVARKSFSYMVKSELNENQAKVAVNTVLKDDLGLRAEIC